MCIHQFANNPEPSNNKLCMKARKCFKTWIPAFAGMTAESVSSCATTSKGAELVILRHPLVGKVARRRRDHGGRNRPKLICFMFTCLLSLQTFSETPNQQPAEGIEKNISQEFILEQEKVFSQQLETLESQETMSQKDVVTYLQIGEQLKALYQLQEKTKQSLSLIEKQVFHLDKLAAGQALKHELGFAQVVLRRERGRLQKKLGLLPLAEKSLIEAWFALKNIERQVEEKSPSESATILLALASIHETTLETDKQIDTYLKLVELANLEVDRENFPAQDLRIKSLSMLAKIYVQEQEFALSIPYFEELLKYYQEKISNSYKQSDIIFYLKTQTQLAEAYSRTQEYEEAKRLYQKTLEFGEATPKNAEDELIIARINSILGYAITSIRAQEFAKAQQIIQKAKPLLDMLLNSQQKASYAEQVFGLESFIAVTKEQQQQIQTLYASPTFSASPALGGVQ